MRHVAAQRLPVLEFLALPVFGEPPGGFGYVGVVLARLPA
jgi:hypothetical protein